MMSSQTSWDPWGADPVLVREGEAEVSHGKFLGNEDTCIIKKVKPIR